ncbi:MAG: adenylate kinase family protein [Candidatus Heimdallarchaeaceae archaeon]
MKKAIVITGTPGTGKSSVASMLEKEGYPVIDAGKYAIENSLYNNYDNKRNSYVIDDDLLTKALIEEIEKNDQNPPLVIEGHAFELPPKFVLHCIVLRCSIRLLRERLVERGYKSSKIDENVEAEIMEVLLTDMLELYGPENVSVIYTDGSFEETYKQVVSIIKKKMKGELPINSNG